MKKIIETTHVLHTFPSVYDENSKILILGSFPSKVSREIDFYYGHPQNRFWKVFSTLLETDLTLLDKQGKIKILLENHIALWDVISECDIIGSSDNSIKNVKANDLSVILESSNIKTIYGNGAKACNLYNQYIYPKTKKEIVKLPSTSPANAKVSLEELVKAYQICLADIKERK